MPRKDDPSFRPVRREWSKQLKDSSAANVLSLAKQLVPLGLWERIFSYEIIVNHQPSLDALKQKDVTVLGRGIQSWGEVDCFACYIAGPGWRQLKRNIVRY
jgi:hypothetical protein